MKTRHLLLNQLPGEPGGAPPAPEKTVRGTNASDLSADTISALAGDLGLDPALFGTPKPAPASPPSPAASATPVAPSPAPNAPNLKAAPAPAAAAPPPAAAAGNLPAGTAPAAQPVELTPEQTDWLTKRSAATTPEEAAQLDASAPAFSDEQWTQAEALLNATPADVRAPGTENELRGQLTAAQAEVTKLKTEAEAQSKRLAEAEAENARLKTQPVAIAPMSPLMTLNPDQLAQAERNAAALKQWCLTHWDGAPAVPASGDQPGQPAYTAEQVRAAFARADDQLTRVIPAARTYAQQFEQENTLAQQVYPELFNPQSPHHQTRENILRRLPGLKAGLPQISTVIGDAIVGEQLRGLLLAEQPTAELKALKDALLKAAPALAKFMPGLAAPATPARQFKLTAKPIVPLARPSGANRSPIQRPAGKGNVAAPNLAKLAKAAGTESENDVLLELVRSQLPGIPTIDPKTEA